MPSRPQPRLVNAAAIQRPAPAGRMAKRRVHLLRPEQIHPLVRIAHRQAGGLQIPERIILDYELVLILRGRGEWTCAGKTRPLAAHDLLLIPPFVPHAFAVGESAGVEHIAVHFDFAPEVPTAARGLAKRRPFRVRFTHGLEFPLQRRLYAGHRVERLLQGVVAAHGGDVVLGPALASALLAEALLNLLAEPAQAPKSDQTARQWTRVEQVTAHMRAQLGADIDHAVLEQVSGLSTSRLQAVFREVTGYPPLDYLRRLRVEEARRLLADARLSVKEVAARTGFRDTSHFSKVFRRIDGLSPAHYREALLAGRQEK
jgi:AraC-like DNA-binding protein